MIFLRPAVPSWAVLITPSTVKKPRYINLLAIVVVLDQAFLPQVQKDFAAVRGFAYTSLWPLQLHARYRTIYSTLLGDFWVHQPFAVSSLLLLVTVIVIPLGSNLPSKIIIAFIVSWRV